MTTWMWKQCLGAQRANLSLGWTGAMGHLNLAWKVEVEQTETMNIVSGKEKASRGWWGACVGISGTLFGWCGGDSELWRGQ